MVPRATIAAVRELVERVLAKACADGHPRTGRFCLTCGERLAEDEEVCCHPGLVIPLTSATLRDTRRLLGHVGRSGWVHSCGGWKPP